MQSATTATTTINDALLIELQTVFGTDNDTNCQLMRRIAQQAIADSTNDSNNTASNTAITSEFWVDDLIEGATIGPVFLNEMDSFIAALQ